MTTTLQLDPVLRPNEEYKSERIYELMRREAEVKGFEPVTKLPKGIKVIHEPRQTTDFLSGRIHESPQRPEMRAVRNAVNSIHRPQELEATVFYCRRSGLPMFRSPSLPWAAMLLEIPFASFNEGTVRKIFRDGLRRDANLETRIFTFYTALQHCPVEFGPECKRPQIPAYAWDTFLRRNLHAIVTFAEWYMSAPSFLKYPSKRALPRLRIMHQNERVSQDTQKSFFIQIRSALTQWIQCKCEYDSGVTKPKLLDRELAEAVEQGSTGILAYSLKDLKKRLLNFNGAGKLCRFDKSHRLAAVYSKERFPQGQTEMRELRCFEKLLEVYEVDEATRYKFILLANNPLSRNIKKLEELKSQFVECWNFYAEDDSGLGEGKETDDFPPEAPDTSGEIEVIKPGEVFSFADLSSLHHEFIRWIRFHIEELSKAQNMMQDMEVLEMEEKEEKKLDEVRKGLGMPLRNDFSTFAGYIAALTKWKRENAK